MNSPETTAFTGSSAVTTGDQRKMDAALKAKWVEALRSGKYQQTAHCLRDGLGGGFCCLGVLADIEGAEWASDTPLIDGRKVNQSDTGYLKEDRFGLRLAAQRVLAKLNDDGKSFSVIADYIEQNL